MKSISNIIAETKIINETKHSALKKYKTKSEDKTINVIVGDIYDFSGDNTVQDKATYYNGDGNGYIIDKNGFVYDVFVKDWNEDSGRFAGGTIKYQCIISKADGKNNATFYGWQGIWSNPSSNTYGSIISDIKDGMYLEDYFAKHKKDLMNGSGVEGWEDLIALGDPNAKTDAEISKGKKADRNEVFDLRYKPFSHILDDKGYNDNCAEGFRVIIIDGKIKFFKSLTYFSDDRVIDTIVPDEKNNKWILSKIQELISKSFNKSLSDLNGLAFNCILTSSTNNEKVKEYKRKHGNDWDYKIGWDTKTNQLVYMNVEKRKIFNDVNFKLQLGQSIYLIEKVISIDKLSKFAKKLFNDVSKTYKKNLGGKTAYIKDATDKIWRTDYSVRSRGEASQKAASEYEILLRSHVFSDKMEKGWGALLWPLTLLAQADSTINPNVEIDMPTVHDIAPEVIDAPEEITSKVETPKSVAGMEPTAHMIERIDNWMNNGKKINIKAAKDDKVICYYKLCHKKDFADGVKTIEDELKRRGIDYKSIKLNEGYYEFIKSINENKYKSLSKYIIK